MGTYKVKGLSLITEARKDMEDFAIIELYFARDEQAIKETDQKYGRLCHCIAENFLQCIEDSEECVNDTYLNLWNTIPPTRPLDFKAFVCKVVRQISMKKLRYNTAQKRNCNVTVSFSELEEVSSDNDVASEQEYRELGRVISDFLWRENEEVRNVFVRRYYFLDSTRDIAAMYGFTESKVKNILYHARNKLKKHLMKEGFAI